MVPNFITFAYKRCKIAAQRNLFVFLANFAFLADFFVIGATIRTGFVSHMRNFFLKMYGRIKEKEKV